MHTYVEAKEPKKKYKTIISSNQQKNAKRQRGAKLFFLPFRSGFVSVLILQSEHYLDHRISTFEWKREN